ncbi:tRNA pseudouridine(55) synthase TruB [soil metagenome]
MTGVLIVDKPVGPTSHDVVASLRKKLKTRAVGHAGTLDPRASGVLVVCVDEATKLVPWLTASDKEYLVTIRLGESTPTLDAGSPVDGTKMVPASWTTTLAAAVARELARTEQIPPIYSAIHKNGVRAHELARRGEEVILDPRKVTLHSLEILALRERDPDARVVCAKGYYVRSLARDLASELGTLGHVTALRRVRSGGFTLADVSDAPLPLAVAAKRALPTATLDDEGVTRARVGKVVLGTSLVPFAAGPHAWLDAAGTLVAIGEREAEGDGARVIRGFVAPAA